MTLIIEKIYKFIINQILIKMFSMINTEMILMYCGFIYLFRPKQIKLDETKCN